MSDQSVDSRQKASDKAAPVINIREMELEDLPAVFAIGEKLFTPDRWPNLYRQWDEYELVDLFASDGEFCLVAEQDDKVVGFVMGTRSSRSARARGNTATWSGSASRRSWRNAESPDD